MRNKTKIIGYILSLFFLLSSIFEESIILLLVAIFLFAFSYFKLGCLKYNCDYNDDL
jgi:hypothetical protein